MRDLRLMTWGPVAAMSLVLALALAAPGPSRSLATPVAVGGAVLGIPHGAVDHLVPRWWAERAAAGLPTARALRQLLFLAAYAGVASVGVVALLSYPVPTFLAFLLLSAIHFGRGELVTSAERSGRRTTQGLPDVLLVGAHGLVVVGLLLWARPDATNPFLRPLSSWMADSALRSRGVGLVLVLVVTLAALCALTLSGRQGEAGELALLAATFAVAPPLLAFGVYFGLWHSVRHTGRLLDLARHHRVCAGQVDIGWRGAADTLAKAALWPSTVALSAVAALWLARDVAGLQAEVAVLLGLTFPHAFLVYLLDRHEATRPHRR